jgi:quinol monooxygenase YgiN
LNAQINNAMKLILSFTVATLLCFNACIAQQESKQMVRLAKLVIDSAQLKEYHAFLKEEIETSLRVEPGVLTLYAVSENARPTRITILEIYASREAYQAHIKTPHFLKYKNGTLSMVKSLELVETTPLFPGVSVR